MNERHRETLPPPCARTRDLLARAVETPLAEAEARDVRQHLDACADCRGVESWVGQVDELASGVAAGPQPAPAWFARVHESVMAEIEGEAAPPAGRRGLSWPFLRWAGGLAAVAVVGFVSWQTLGPATESVEMAARDETPSPKTESSPPTVERGLGKVSGAAPPGAAPRKALGEEAFEETSKEIFVDETLDRPAAPGATAQSMVVEGEAGRGARDLVLQEELELPRSALPERARLSVAAPTSPAARLRLALDSAREGTRGTASPEESVARLLQEIDVAQEGPARRPESDADVSDALEPLLQEAENFLEQTLSSLGDADLRERVENWLAARAKSRE